MAHPNTCPVSFTYVPMAFMWVVTPHNLFLYSEPPLPSHPPSYWLRLFSSQTFSRINTPTFSNLVILQILCYFVTIRRIINQIKNLFVYEPIKMEQTECSEMSAYKIQMPGNYPEESIQHSEHDKSLKSRNFFFCLHHAFCLLD